MPTMTLSGPEYADDTNITHLGGEEDTCKAEQSRDYQQDQDEETYSESFPLIISPSRHWQSLPKSSFTTLTLQHISKRTITLVRSIGWSLLPSYVRNHLNGGPAFTSSTQAIAPLDGLRGFACLIVLNEHFTYMYTSSFSHGYGVEDHRAVIQLPIIRLMVSGSAMIGVFFVLSGYVLSYKPLKLIRKRAHGELHQTLTSSTFRRVFRLYLPPIVAVIILAIATWLGLFEVAQNTYDLKHGNTPISMQPPKNFHSLFLQLQDALCDCWSLVSQIIPWNASEIRAEVRYDGVQWTMPVELRGSIALYLVLLATSRLTTKARLGYVIVLFVFSALTQREDTALFFAGFLLCEMDLINSEHEALETSCANSGFTSASTSFPRILPRQLNIFRILSNVFSLFVFIVGLFLVSSPVHGLGATLGYSTLSTIFQSYGPELYRSILVHDIGAIITVWSVANVSLIQPVFTNRVAAYLGKISFSLYLVHANVVKMLGYAILDWTFFMGGGAGQDQNEMSSITIAIAWLCGYICVLPVSLWLADLFWRAVDIPSVNFARRIESKLSISMADERIDLGAMPTAAVARRIE